MASDSALVAGTCFIAVHSFTIEEGRLFILQTRTAKRTAAAALRCAVDMVGDGLISREEAVARIDTALVWTK